MNAMPTAPFLLARLRLLLAGMLALLLFATAAPAPAEAGIEPGTGKGWLTIASRTRAEDAIAIARGHAARFPGAVVFHSSNGYYAVSLGWADVTAGQGLLRSLIAEGAIPGDSYYTAGKRFVRPIWSASGAHGASIGQLFAVTRLNISGGWSPPTTPAPPSGPVIADPMEPRPGVVYNLSGGGDNYLSLRSGPGTNYREMVRMRPGTQMTVTGSKGRWMQVALSNGMTGWAHGKYIRLGNVPMVGPDTAQSGSDVPMVGPDKGGDSGTGRDVAETPAKPDSDDATAEPEKPPVQHAKPAKPLAEQKRVALVLGNSDYVHTTELANPKNDAEAMTAQLRALGFEVVTGLDGNKPQMEKAVREFVRILPDSDVALFFYAGHAMQVNGRNHLIPVDAKLEDATALDFETIDLQVVLNFMNSGDRISIALLDACRDNPLSRRFARSLGATRSAFIGRGLAAPQTAGGELLIGFATAPGEVALDGDGDNSPFTTALLNHIGTQGLDIELMLKRVRNEVFETTDRSQEPWVNSALRQEFQFNPKQ